MTFGKSFISGAEGEVDRTGRVRYRIRGKWRRKIKKGTRWESEHRKDGEGGWGGRLREREIQNRWKMQ